ncbi:hypothetical protein EV213_12133 [Aureibacillus halotolerans]|uniref:Uncharacterized protein n=1 Tax=Aureibacillus halotolerans TaxID=1508390 RepID=A0A4R6TVX2_9BACI|nr:hypothetical protein EV213_12133 [Aureibacillus halotolerans]
MGLSKAKKLVLKLKEQGIKAELCIPRSHLHINNQGPKTEPQS